MSKTEEALPPLPEPQTLITDADVGSRAYTAWQMRDYARAALAQRQQVPAHDAPQKLAKELIRLAGILRDCGRLISKSGDAERIMLEASAALTAAPPAQQQSEPTSGNWIAADDYYRNVRALDVALNGEGGATRPLLIDVLSQVQAEVRRIGRPLLAAQQQSAQPEPLKHRQGCDALGGYGHGIGPCTCGAAPPTAQPEQQQDQSNAIGALRELDARLRECFGKPITAEEAYDSYFQEMVSMEIGKQEQS